ncbi:Histidine-containing phosphotransfer protein [Heracleum sosnowskyi]|uniref:Histidine-containing phosphotransfer protein n=1 Tax=Heracleum sosnowskyi TaxID=360622 RepID=A0AAD8MHV5_9APIA|nr:Histidine-containing phosphotransfer protein [Heracleum sosnowskyi]
METVNQLQQQYVDFLSSLYSEGLLENQFQNIQMLGEDEAQFVSELLALYFEDSERCLHNLTTAFDQKDVEYEKVHDIAVELYDCNLSLGIQRMNNVCVTFRSCYKSKNLEGCLRCMQTLKDEYYLVKSKLQTLVMLDQRIVAAGGLVPIVE